MVPPSLTAHLRTLKIIHKQTVVIFIISYEQQLKTQVRMHDSSFIYGLIINWNYMYLIIKEAWKSCLDISLVKRMNTGAKSFLYLYVSILSVPCLNRTVTYIPLL